MQQSPTSYDAFCSSDTQLRLSFGLKNYFMRYTSMKPLYGEKCQVFWIYSATYQTITLIKYCKKDVFTITIKSINYQIGLVVPKKSQLGEMMVNS